VCVLLSVTRTSRAVTVTLDDGTVFEVGPEALPGDLPSPGERLAAPQVAALALAADRKRAARALLAQLDRRLLPVARLREKLLALDLAAPAVEAVLAEAAARGLHDDRRYAEAWCRDTLRAREVGGVYLRAHLRRQGVPDDVAATVVAEILPREVEEELARAAATRRWARERGRDRTAIARVVRFLITRGFPARLGEAAARATAPQDE
jgi:SOS response regulatory protein OraA/RecX